MIVNEEELDWPTLSHLVKCHSSLRPLIDRLLGQTYLADDFERAREAAHRSYDLRFVTRTGDILEPDGSVGTGKPNKTVGILARSAEILRPEGASRSFGSKNRSVGIRIRSPRHGSSADRNTAQ